MGAKRRVRTDVDLGGIGMELVSVEGGLVTVRNLDTGLEVILTLAQARAFGITI
jgi:multisubunit Na+/H+ antiporter MnhB subunit